MDKATPPAGLSPEQQAELLRAREKPLTRPSDAAEESPTAWEQTLPPEGHADDTPSAAGPAGASANPSPDRTAPTPSPIPAQDEPSAALAPRSSALAPAIESSPGGASPVALPGARSGGGDFNPGITRSSAPVDGTAHGLAPVSTSPVDRTPQVPGHAGISGPSAPQRSPAAVLGTGHGQVTEDAPSNTATGQLQVVDPDPNESHFKPEQALAGRFGQLSLTEAGEWTYTLDNRNPAVQALGEHGTAQDILTVHTADGTPTQITITIQGTPDAAVISGQATGSVTEDTLLQAEGTLAITDPDAGEAHFVAGDQSGLHGSFHLESNGHWTYALTNSQSAVQALGAGETATEWFTVQAADGTPHRVSVILHGSNDQPQITGTTAARLQEGAAAQTVGGQLNSTDADAHASLGWSVDHVDGQFGKLHFDTTTGHWAYTLDPARAQHLALGQTATERFAATVTDEHGASSQTTLVVTIEGRNDAPVLRAMQALPLHEDDSSIRGQALAADPDLGDRLSFSTPTPVAGFSLQPDGHYQFNPGDAAYQSLAAGQTRTLTIPIVVTDGHGASATQSLTLVISGRNDGATVIGTSTGTVTEDTALSCHGQLQVSDVDQGESAFAPALLNGQFGTLAIDATGQWHYQLDNHLPAVQGLAPGQQVSEVLTVHTLDGTPHRLTVSVEGSNDAPTLTAQAHSVTEDGQGLSGQLQASDIDQGDHLIYSSRGTLPGFALNADGSYTFDPTHAAWQHLAAGQVQVVTVPVTVTDGSGASASQTLTITLTGRNDGAVISGVDAGRVAEDQSVQAGQLQTSGQLIATDVDSGEDHFAALTGVQATYGQFSIDTAGHWTYSADNAQAAVQQLKAGESLTDRFTVSSADGTTHVVTVTLQGRNDAPVLAAQTHTVTEDGAVLSGQLQATDVDAGDTRSFSMAHPVDGLVLNADGSYTFDPSHSGYQHLAAGQTQDLVIPVTVTDGAGASHTQNLTIQIIGQADGAVIAGLDAGAVTEDLDLQAGQLQASGALTVTDLDAGEDHFTALSQVAGHYGSFSIDAAGHWNYAADNTQAAIQQLAPGQTLSESFTVQSADGTQHTVSVTLSGTNDAPVLAAQTQAVTEDGALLNGRMTATDIDQGDTQAWSLAKAVDGFTLYADGSYRFDPSHSAYQHLAAGQTQDVVIPVTVTDHAGATSTQNLTITISGSNDAPRVTGGQFGVVVEDGTAVAPVAQQVMDFGPNRDGAVMPVGALKTPDMTAMSLEFTVMSDGRAINSSHHGETYLSYATPNHNNEFYVWRPDNLTVSIGNQEHPTGIDIDDGRSHRVSVVWSSSTGSLDVLVDGVVRHHADGYQQGHVMMGGGALVLGQDIDNYAPQTGSTPWSQYGFDLDDAFHGQLVNATMANSAVDPKVLTGATLAQHLAQDPSLFLDVRVDGQGQIVDATGNHQLVMHPGVGVASVMADASVVTNLGQQQVDGQLIAQDLDDGQSSLAAQGPLQGTYGVFQIDASGHWHYALDNARPAVQALVEGEQVTDRFEVSTTDGTKVSVAITVLGRNDVALISGVDQGRVAEDQQVSAQGHLEVTGQLSVHDADHGESQFVPASGLTSTQGLGHLAIDANGAWHYSLDNTLQAVQNLHANQHLNEQFTVHSLDGTTHTVLVTITGTNDAPVLAAQTQAVTEDGALLRGQMVATDVDHADTQAYSLAHPVAGLTLNADGSYSFDPSNSAWQHLAAGQTQAVVIPVTVTDSAGATSTQNLTITLTGTNDGAVIAGADTGTVTEDNQLSASGKLVVTDVDTGEDTFQAQAHIAGAHGAFSLAADGSWTYTLDNGNAAVQALTHRDILTDSVTVKSADGTTHQINVSIKGTDDGAVIAGSDTGAVTEDANLSVGKLQASGQLQVTDADAGQDHFNAQHNAAGTYGSFSVDATGHWTYSADNSQAAVQNLKAGATLTDSLTVSSADGTTHTVTVTITGTNDAPSLLVRSHAIAEDAASLSGKVLVDDVDSGDSHTYSINQQVAGFTLDADGSYRFDPSDAAYQHLAQGQHQTLIIPVTVTDSAGATDTQQLMIVVSGSDDGAVITGLDTGTVTEDNQLSASGKLVVTDVDTGEDTFQAQAHIAGAHGAFSLAADGSWTYTLDNGNAAVQALTHRDILTDSVTVKSADGTTHQINVSIKGTDDGAVIAGSDTGAVTEDANLSVGKLQASGQLQVTDADAGQDHFNAQNNAAGTYGSFSVDATGHWTYSADNSQAAVQSLKAGATLIDSLTVASADGTTHTVLVMITGTNDAPVLVAQTQAVTEDGALLRGQMVASDLDHADTQAFSLAKPVDGFTLNADGSYRFDPSHASYQHLAAGQTQDVVIPVTVTDSAGATSTQNLTISVSGINDGAIVGGRLASNVTEDAVRPADDLLRTGGQLTVFDPDAGEDRFVAQVGVSGAGHYGSFSIDAAGHYSYTADNTQAAIQQLKAGETLTDRFTVATADGTQQVVTITINGAEDRPVLQAQTHAVTEDGTRLTGQMLATDVDAGDTQRFSIAQQVAGLTFNADGSYSFDPSHAAYQHLAAGQTQAVVIPVTVTDSAGATSTQNLTITVAGSNDGPTISGTAVANLREDAATRSVSQTLTATDVDDGDVATWALVGSGQGTYGQLVFDPQHQRWTYTLDNADADTNALQVGQRVTEIFQITATDRSGVTATQAIRVNIVGSNDAPTIAGTATGTVIESDRAHATIGGTLTHADVDSGDSFNWSLNSGQGSFGSLAFDAATGQWRYTLDESRPATQSLNAGQTVAEHFAVTGVDKAGAQARQMITVSVQGSNDNPVVAGAREGSVVEDRTLMATGTLSSTDLDGGDRPASWQVLAPQGSYGALSIDSHGAWTYHLDVAASQSLKAGAVVDESFVVRVTDLHGGTADQAITIHVTGSNDAPRIDATQAALSGDVTEDQIGATTTGGTLTSGDPDLGDALVWGMSRGTGNSQLGRYGTFTLGADGTWSYALDHARANALPEGTTATETFRVHVTDAAGERSTAAVTVRVHGTNDGPAIGGQTQGDVTENKAPTAQGTLASGDPDQHDTATWTLVGNGSGQYGDLTLDSQGHWHYALAQTPRVETLGEGQTVQESFSVRVVDAHGAESTQQITVHVHGSNDSPTIAGTVSGQLTEDGSNTTAGHLTATDVDQGDHASFEATTFIGNFGQLTIDATGLWHYEILPMAPHVQALAAGQRVTESFNVSAVDAHGGVTLQPITVTLVGTNDRPQISGVTTGVAVSHIQNTAEGRLVAQDVDLGDTATWSLADGHGRYGDLVLNQHGEWSYQLDLTRPVTRNLQIGQQVSETFAVTVTDSQGATDVRQIHVTVFGAQGSADATGGAVSGGQPPVTGPGTASNSPTVIPPIAVSVTEDAVITQSGRLASADLRAGAYTWQVSPVMGVYGELAVDRYGHWQYHLHDGAPQVQALSAGQTVHESFSLTGQDANGHEIRTQVQVGIQGTNDRPEITGVDTGVAVEDLRTDVTGSLAVSDLDAGETAHWQALDSQGSYGSFGIDAHGDWHYQLDPVRSQTLNAGQSVVEVFRVNVTDKAGAVSEVHEVTVQVQGTADGPQLRGIMAGVVDTAHPSLSGVMPVLDRDIGDQHSFSLQSPAQGTYGVLTLSPDGHFHYQLDPANAQQIALAHGQVVTETYTVQVADSTGAIHARQLRVEVLGTNDAPVIKGALATAVLEDAQLLSHGQLTLDDPDLGDSATLLSHHQTGQYGVFDISEDGQWTYALDNLAPAVQALGEGQTLTDRVQITLRDEHGLETTREMVVTVRGTNDVPVIAGSLAGSVTEDGPTQVVSGQLTSTDADAGDHTSWNNLDSPGTYGHFSLGSDGAWHYQLDSASAAVQSLAAGQVVTERFTARGTDGHGGDVTQTIEVSITGANDAARITGQSTGAVTEDLHIGTGGTIQTSGQLNVADVDTGEGHFAAQTQVAGSHHLGSFSIDTAGHWTYSADDRQAAVQSLKAGATLTDSLTVTSADGTSHTVTVTITGTNDAPVLAAQTQAVTEDGALLRGQMVATDVDHADTQAFSLAHPVAGLTLHADGSYAFDPSVAAYQHLAAGQTQAVVIPVTVTDSAGATSTQNLTITVTGANDGAVIGGRLANAVSEDGVVSAGGLLRAAGQLTVIDPDAGESVFVAQTGVTGAGHYGNFSIDAAGHYSYTADNTQTAIQQLKAGETLTDRFTVATADGTQQVVVITIEGAEDRPVIQAQSQSVTEDGTRLTGQMLATDVDAGDTKVFSIAQAVDGFTFNADGSYRFDPSHASYQQLAAGQTQDLVIPVTVTDSAGATHTQNLTITITGANDGAVIGGVNVGTVTEDTAVTTGHLQANGQLTVADADTGEAHFVAQTDVAGNHGLGHFSLDASGAWSYTADNTQAAIQQLKSGESLTETLTVASADGATHTVTVTIEGTNDVPVLQAQTQAVTEDGALLRGHMVATDVDAGDALTFSIAQPVDGFTLNADGSYRFDPSHTAYQHLAAGQAQNLLIPVTVTDSAGATHTQNLSITLTGGNDAPRITGADTGRVVEDQTLSVSGQLAISDADDGQAHFVAQAATAGSYGSLTLAEDGHWQYQLDNGKAEVQALKSTDTATDSFTVQSADGSSHRITVSIQGQRDSVVIGGVDVGVVKEDVSAVTGGHLVATGESAEFVPLQQRTSLGDFSMDAAGAWTYTLDNSRAATEALKNGETATDTVSITHTDGTTHTVTITIMGSNDGPVLQAQAQSVTEDGALLNGRMLAADVDAGDTQAFSISKAVDGFTLNADGSYSFDPSNAAYQHLAAGQTQDVVIPVTVTDIAGATHTQNLTITIAGSNDGAQITGVDTGRVAEDQNVNAGQLQASGQLTLSDADAGQHQFTAQSQVAGHYGSFSIDASGTWTYTADNSQDAVQQLGRNDSLVERFNVTSADGTQHTVLVTLQGSNDAPVIQAQTRSVTEDGAMLTGQMRASDTDIHDRLQFSTTAQIAGFTLAADGSYSFDPKASAYQNLGSGVAETLHIPVTVRDPGGEEHTRDLLITVTGTNDGAIIQGKDHGDVVEDLNPVGGQLRAQGHLGVTDADASQSAFVVQTGVMGHFGRFSIDAAGTWTYEVDNSSDRVQALREGAQAVEHFVVRSLDGTSHAVRVIVHGSNDAPVVTSTAQTAIEDGALLHGQLRVSDRDRGDQAHFQLDHPVAGFTLDSDGTYRFNPADPAHQDLRAGQVMRLDIPVTVTDESGAVVHQTVTINLTGRNDAAVISGADQATVTEDSGLQNGLLQAGGQLQVSDIDDGEAHFAVQAGVAGSNGLGHFSIQAGGHWIYTADNTLAAVQQLKAGESLTDTLTVSSADGTTHTVTVTIQGANDAPVLQAQSQAVVEDGTLLQGSLVATDVDAGDTKRFSVAQTVDGFALNADGSYRFDPSHASYQHLATGQTQDIVIPVTVTDSAGLTSTQNLTITLTGSNDGPLVTHGTTATAADLGAIHEDAPRVFTEAELLQAVGASDADDGSNLHIVAGSLTSAHGSFTGDAAHGYTFTPAANFSGQNVDLQFSMTDGSVSREAHAQLDVTPVADAPVRDVAPVITTDFNHPALGDPGWKMSDPTPLGWHTSESGGVEIGQERLYGGSGNNQLLSLTASWNNNLYRDLPTKAGQTVHVDFDLSARPGFAMTPVEVLWEGKVVDTISPTAGTYAMQHHGYDLVATGSNARLEFRATGQGEARALFDNIQIGTSDHLTLGDQDTLLKPYLGYQLADTDGSETLSYAIHGLPVGFTLTDGTHSATVATAGQVIETTGWNQESLALRAPHDFQGDTSIQVTARAEEGSNHQTASAADLTLHLSGLPVSHAAVIGGDTAVTVTEDQQVNSQGNLEHFGQLTINDPDAGQAQFVPQNAVVAQYGHYTIDQRGFWLYEADNKLAAIQQLKTGEHLTDSFTVHSADGTAQTITVTIQGQDDAPAFVPHGGPTSSDDVYTQIAQALETRSHQNFKYLASMMLHGADTYPFERALVVIKNAGISFISPDGNVAKAFAPHGGTLTEVPISEMIAWHAKGAGYQVVFTDTKASEVGVYAYNNGNPGMLSGRYPYTDWVLHPEQQAATLYPVMHDVAAASGGAAVQGALPMPPAIAPLLFDGGHVLEDSGLLVTGFIEVKDADAQQSAMRPQTGTATHYGRFSIDVNGDWIYQLDNSRPEVQKLGDGQTLVDTITVHSEDGTAHEVNVTIHGQNDGAVIAGTDSGTVVEDHHLTAAGTIVAQGQLTVTDPDAVQDHFIEQSDVAGSAGLGRFSLDAQGRWTYSADNSLAPIQALKAGESLSDSITVHSADGSSHVVSVLIQGANDAPILQAQSQTVAEDGSLLQGRLLASDADHGEHLQFSSSAQVGGFTLHADGSYAFDPSHADYQSLGAGQQRDIAIPIVVSDSAGAHGMQFLTLHVTGRDDGAVISGVDTGQVQVGAQARADGQLQVSDADAGQTGFQAGQLAGSFGSLSIDAQGHWQYQLQAGDPALQQLQPYASIVDHLSVHSLDGTAHSIDVQIEGPAVMVQPSVIPQQGHDAYADILAAVRAGGYQYQAIADALENGDRTSMAHVELSISGSHVQIVDAAGNELQSYGPVSADYAATIPMADLMRWHAQGHSIIVSNDSGLSSTHVWLHDAGEMHDLHVNVGGSGFNGWVGEYSLGELQLSGPAPAPWPDAAVSAGVGSDEPIQQDLDPPPKIVGEEATGIVRTGSERESQPDHHDEPAPEQGHLQDYLQFSSTTVLTPGNGHPEATVPHGVSDYLAAAGVDPGLLHTPDVVAEPAEWLADHMGPTGDEQTDKTDTPVDFADLVPEDPQFQISEDPQHHGV